MEKFNGDEKRNICSGDFKWSSQYIINNGDKNMTIMYVHKKWKAIMVLKQ
jgi:hypothetical protein